MRNLSWLPESFAKEIAEQADLPLWAVRMAEQAVMPGDVKRLVEIARTLVEIGGRNSPGPGWLPISEKLKLQQKYGVMAVNWAEALLPPGTPIEVVEETAKNLLKKMRRTLGI